MKDTDKKIALEIMELALNCEIAQVFVTYSPHIRGIEARAYYPKWTKENTHDFESHGYSIEGEDYAGLTFANVQKQLIEFLANPKKKEPETVQI